MLLHEGGTVNGGCAVCLSILGRQAADKEGLDRLFNSGTIFPEPSASKNGGGNKKKEEQEKKGSGGEKDSDANKKKEKESADPSHKNPPEEADKPLEEGAAKPEEDGKKSEQSGADKNSHEEEVKRPDTTPFYAACWSTGAHRPGFFEEIKERWWSSNSRNSNSSANYWTTDSALFRRERGDFSLSLYHPGDLRVAKEDGRRDKLPSTTLVEKQQTYELNQLADLLGGLDALDRGKQPASDTEKVLRENGLGYFIDNSIQPAAEKHPIYYEPIKSQWEKIAKSYPNEDQERLKNVLTGWAMAVEEKRKYLKERDGLGYNESAFHKGLPKYQEISRQAARVLNEEKKPEHKLLSNIVTSVFKPSLELKETIRMINKCALNKAAKELESVNRHNGKINFSIAKAEIKELIDTRYKYDKIAEECRNGKGMVEAIIYEWSDLAMKVRAGATQVKLAEERGRAARLAQQLENTSRHGGDVDLLAPPVAGSRSKFISTKPLNASHDILADQDLRSAAKIASRLVYGPIGLKVTQFLEYPIDKIDQKVLQAKEKRSKYNATVALERSREFQRRQYGSESMDCRLDWLSQAMSSDNEESAVGSREPTTDFNSDSSMGFPSSAEKKQRTPHVAP